ncbi:MAG: nuclear transport factor 2 family protein [Candidatus Aminicenantes bacterium]|nr:nuclear transport factor 2 family protein [Candidatus Aminicenantes bacterium]
MDSIKARRGSGSVPGLCILGFAGWLLCSPSIAGVEGCAAPPEQASPQDEKAVIAKVIKDSICWALTKDRALADSTMAQDEDLFYFWTGSTHTVTGWKQDQKTFETFMDPRFKAVRTEVHDLRVHYSRSGDVAWYSATLDDVVEWEGKRGGGEDIRWTGVLEKRDGKWLIVQMHASLAADKVRESVLKNGK